MQLKNQGRCDPLGNDPISPPTDPWIVDQHRVSLDTTSTEPDFLELITRFCTLLFCPRSQR